MFDRDNFIKGLKTLSRQEKLILQLKYLEELTDDEISAAMSIPVYEIGIIASNAKTKMNCYTNALANIDNAGAKMLNKQTNR